jgi:hypothetical protein
MDPQNKSVATPSDSATPSNGLSNNAQEVTVNFNDTPAPGAASPAGMPSPTTSGFANGPMPTPVIPAGAAADGVPDASLESTFPAPTPLQGGPGNPTNGSADFGVPAGGPASFGGPAPGTPGGFPNQPMPTAPNPYPAPPAPFGQQPDVQPLNAPAVKKPLDKKTFFILMGAALVLIIAIVTLFFLK